MTFHGGQQLSLQSCQPNKLETHRELSKSPHRVFPVQRCPHQRMTRLRPRQLSDLPKLDQSGQRYFPMSKDVGDVIDRIDCLNES